MPQINISENSSNIANIISEQASTHISAFLCGGSFYQKIVESESPTPSYKIFNNPQELISLFNSSVLSGSSSGFAGSNFGFTGGSTLDRELHSALNYLQYGGILIAATGASALNRNDLELDSIFCENTTKFDDVIRLVAMRQNCVGIIGSSFEYHNGSTGTYPSALTLCSFTGITGISGITSYEDLFFSVFGRKTRNRLYGGETAPISILLTSDAAGCLARTDTLFQPWYAPAGINRGKINSYVTITPSLTDTDISTLIDDVNTNPFSQLVASDGAFLVGDRTAEKTDTDKKQIGVSRLIVYIKNSFKPLLDSVLFELNDSETRERFVTSGSAIMEFIKTSRGISSYSLVCDDSNNTATTIANRQFIVDLSFKPVYSINQISFRFTINQS
jgi:hypothetical protein